MVPTFNENLMINLTSEQLQLLDMVMKYPNVSIKQVSALVGKYAVKDVELMVRHGVIQENIPRTTIAQLLNATARGHLSAPPNDPEYSITGLGIRAIQSAKEAAKIR